MTTLAEYFKPDETREYRHFRYVEDIGICRIIIGDNFIVYHIEDG